MIIYNLITIDSKGMFPSHQFPATYKDVCDSKRIKAETHELSQVNKTSINFLLMPGTEPCAEIAVSMEASTASLVFAQASASPMVAPQLS